MRPETDNHEQLPEALVERLRQREQGLAILTPAVDRAIQEAARRQFAPVSAPVPAARRWRYSMAAAAALAMLALVLVRPFEPDEPVSSFSSAEPALVDDVDGSGRVDILDVYALARTRIANPEAVSQERIDSIASRIVSLAPPESVL